MSDNSNSTGSSGSSANSWTLLSPEEAAVESVGPVDDGTESLGDVPSLSEEVAGAVGELRASDVPVETVLSEEGHQICQETSPESSEGPVPSSPGRMSPVSDLDLESQPPVIHGIDASSPSDSDLLGAAPFVTNIDLGIPLDIPPVGLPPADPEEFYSAPPIEEISTEPSLDTDALIGSFPGSRAEESPEFHIPAETLTATDAPSHVGADARFEPESTESENLATEQPREETPAPENVGFMDAQIEATVEKEETEKPEIQEEAEEREDPSTRFDPDDASSFDAGLRRRNVPERSRTSDEEDEEEEVEFRLPDKKEEKPWLSLNKCIVGALILLFLGSLFLSSDFDASDLGDAEQSQDWLSSDPQDMKALLDKLTQENQQIALLEAQLQSQKEELDSALRALAANGDEMVKADLEKENTKLKEELLSLPELKKELESLRARVTELSQLTVTAGQEFPPATPSAAPQPDDKYSQSIQKAAEPEMRKGKNEEGKLKKELQRQKGLLEESRKRLEGMKKHGGDRKGVRDSLQEIQRKLSEQVESWGKKKKKPQESKWKGNKGKGKEQDHKKREEKKEWKHSKEEGLKDREDKKEKEWKPQKQNSHKEEWRKHQDEWERKKDERRMDREERRKEKPWHSQSGKNPHGHHHHHHHHHQHHHQRQPQQHNDFWRDQEQKLQRNIRPQLGCTSVEDCASREGLYPVELPEFEELLEGYLSKLEGSSVDSKDKIRKLTADFFEDGVFIHDRVLFSDFAEDVADVLEDMVDVGGGNGHKDDDSLEEEMEEFEREALWKFAATA